MVNTENVSRYKGPLPKGDADNRGIPHGPLYPADEVIGLLDSNGGGNAIHAWTRKCIRDIQKWDLDEEDLLSLVESAVRNGRFTGSEWCEQSPDGPLAACDAYSVVRREWVQAASES